MIVVTIAETSMTRVRPNRSESALAGMIDRASIPVVTETVRAAEAGLTPDPRRVPAAPPGFRRAPRKSPVPRRTAHRSGAGNRRYLSDGVTDPRHFGRWWCPRCSQPSPWVSMLLVIRHIAEMSNIPIYNSFSA